MPSIFFDNHHGLGDEIICNGLTRELCKKYNRVGIFCFERNYPSVSFMYRDLTNLRIHVIRSHSQRRYFRLINAFRFGKNHYDIVRIAGNFDQELGVHFDRQYYKLAGVDFKKKWDSFSIVRDEKREAALFEKTGLSQPYQFVHDDSRYLIDSAKTSPSLPIFRLDKKLTDNVFDYCTLIECADEIHVIDSSFMNLIDCLPSVNDAQKLYVHQYARTSPAWNSPLLKKPWVMLS